MKKSRIFACVSFIAAAAANLSPAELVAVLPQCALTCLVKSVAISSCSATNQTCICTNEPLNDAIRACVEETCTIKEGLITLNATSNACGAPVRDKRKEYNILSITLGSFSIGCVILRMFSRYISDAEFGMDDYATVFTALVGLPSSVMNVVGLTAHGLGTDIWTLSFRTISDFIHYFFAMELLYFTQVGLVKLAFLFFYLRIFANRPIRITLWITIAFNVVFTFIFVIIGLLQCRPISYYWKRWDNAHNGSCLDINALGFSNAGISILLDVWTLILPLTQIMGLNLHWKKKVGVAMMFSVGAFVTIVSIIRLRTLIVFSASQNPSWDYVGIGYWSTIEINVGLICACMPNLRYLLLRTFPRLRGGSTLKASYPSDRKGSSALGGRDMKRGMQSVEETQWDRTESAIELVPQPLSVADVGRRKESDDRVTGGGDGFV